ncbi:acetate kinase [Friedmanniella endophytica]|uniref:Acetate kinase n=1 Tax=Microlunatus kandeliicorticis TaxID=1759536 RepID=A0A7W3P5D9_9ACTN|nr:acetate kinase [Microlunatus kandeliicorticis]MBA8793770.1 acetate kinase [Microlunatus kandeliicorticis]
MEQRADAPRDLVLVINSGSSSLKYQLLRAGRAEVLTKGTIERIGEPDGVADHDAAMTAMTDQLADRDLHLDRLGVVAVGHRVVHGGERFSEPTVIDDAVVAAIDELSALAPLHNPPALAGIRAAQRMLPDVPHVAVFDTAFFTGLPEAARTYAVPTELAARHGIRRYGFHGTSHAYVSALAAETVGRPTEELDQIVLHLGNGCSASAIHHGAAVETSMGLTPLQGLVMGTRSGDVDPGLHGFLARTERLDAGAIDTLLNKQSGLKGLAGVNDFRELEQRRATGDAAAALAFAVYVHRIRCYVGAYLVTLGRLDTLVFTAGVGENNAALRAAVADGLDGFGIAVDPARNQAASGDPRVISPDGTAVTVLVVPTDEELAIARQAVALVG